MLAVAHQLEAAERRGTRVVSARWRAAVYDRADRLDRNDVGLAVHELHQQPRELTELRALGIGPAALGNFTRGVRDRRGRHLKQLGDRLTHAGGRRAAGPAQLTDRLLDALEEVRQWRQIGERREPAERLQRLEDVLQRVVRQRIAAQRAARAIQRARNRGAFTRDERAGTGVEAHRLRGADLRRGTSPELLELGGERFGFGGVGIGPTGGLADEDFEVVDRTRGDLLRGRVPGAAALAHTARQRLESHRRPRDSLLARHQRAAAQRARQTDEL